MGGKQPGDVRLREGGGGAQDQLDPADGFCDVVRHQRQLHVVAAVVVLHEDAGAGGAVCFDLLSVAAPKLDRMPRQRKVACGRERPVSST